MADERDRWLDEAAAEAFLRGGPTEPVGPAADTRAAMEAARLRAALDALAAMAAPAPLGTELPGEGVAVDAYRAARGAVRPAAVPSAADGSGEPLVDLGRVFPAPAPVPARRRARICLYVYKRQSESPVPGVGTSAPTLTPKLRPTPLPDGSDPAFAPVTPSPGPDGRTTPGTAAGPDTSTGTTTTGGGAGKGLQDDRSGQGDREGSRDTLGTGELGKDRQREQDSRLKADLCQEYRKGRLNEDRRERLTRLADGLLRIPAYCASVLDGESDGTKRRDAPLGGGTLRAPSMSPAVPQGSTPLRVGP